MLFALVFLAVALTYTMFMSRNWMLGFPSAMFWAIFGAYSFTQSVTPWGDIYYYLFFASTFGMTLFTAFAAYGLREVRDEGTDEDEYIDEKGDSTSTQGEDEKNQEKSRASDDGFSGDARPSRRTAALRERARLRRTGGEPRKKRPWGEFR